MMLPIMNVQFVICAGIVMATPFFLARPGLSAAPAAVVKGQVSNPGFATQAAAVGLPAPLQPKYKVSASFSIPADLDGDGRKESVLTLRPCAAAGGGTTCLSVQSPLVGTKEVIVSNSPNACRGTVGFKLGTPIGAPVVVIGNHVNDAIAEVAVLYCQNQGTAAPPALAVIDVSKGVVIANAVAPTNQFTSFTDFPKAPGGKLVPFLAPSYGDSDSTPSMYTDGLWGYMCIFSATARSSSQCGPGFIEVSTAPEKNFFRESSGYMQDLDGDGWEDINLLFHKRVYTISSRTGEVLQNLEYDVAAMTEPDSPKWFHSGRNYGTHSAINSRGVLRTIEVGGVGVGVFADAFANVSRFIAVLEGIPGEPSSRTLRWSKYFGFHSNSFASFDPTLASAPPIGRPGDFSNGAIHRFSDSRSVVNAQEAIIFNYFKQTALIDRCIAVQYQLYLPPAWTKEKQDNWNNCLKKNLKSKGSWAVQALAQKDGSMLLDTPNIYIWGKTTDVLPGNEIIYLVEELPGSMVYDLSDRQPGILKLSAITRAAWMIRAAFPAQGRPKIDLVSPTGSASANYSSPFAELSLKDIDGDGLKDIHMADGSWVGYDRASGRVVRKSDAAGSP